MTTHTRKLVLREYHVYATDGAGLYAGMRNFFSCSPEGAIEQGKAAFRDVPASCTQWVATTDRAAVRSGRR